jgi:chromosome segregation ATPase
MKEFVYNPSDAYISKILVNRKRKNNLETEAVTEGETEPETEIDTEPETEIEETKPVEDIFATNPEEDIFANAKLHEDKIVSSKFEDEDDEYKDFAYFPEHSSKSGLVQEVSATISELVKLNKSQRQKLMSYEEQMDQMSDANRRMNEKLREQTRDYEKLRTTAENFKTVVSKLEAKCEVLEGKNEALEAKTHDQERTIYRLTAENTSLREQSLNNDMLAQVLAEARSALTSDEEDLGYYRKVA